MSGPLVCGQVVDDRYEVVNYLAEGGMQFVYVAMDRVTGRTVALKTPKNHSAEKRFNRSAIVAAKVNHPNVAKTFDYLEKGGRAYLIEELVNGNDLKLSLLTRTKYIDPYLIAKVFHHIVGGVAAAHHRNVIHRDLKPSNIMVVGGYNVSELKITDFGIAKMAEAELEEAAEGGEASLSASATAVGALPYMAPEAIETPESVGLSADIWSVGAIVMHMLIGDYPFGSGLKSVPRILSLKISTIPAIVRQNPQFKSLADEVITIANSCLKLDPSSRPTADQLVSACNDLCYSTSERFEGKVNNFQYNAYGFIYEGGREVFFHKNSVFGEIPKVNDRVIFSCYDGGQKPRALPVLKLDN